MATSGSNNFNQTRNAIILDAFSLLGVSGIGRTPSAEDMTLAANFLNMLIKSWSTQGLHLWCKSEGILHLTQYTAKYTLGDASTCAYVTSATDEIITQLNGALAAATTTITVDSTAGMLAGDHIGVVLSDKSLFWATITTVLSPTTILLATGLSGAALDNALVYTFTNRIYKPLRILSARLVGGFDSGATSTKTEVVLTSMAYQSYYNLPAKTVNGRPNQVCYLPNRLSGDFYVWPRPADMSYRVEFSYERIIEDLDTLSDDFDLPVEWELPIVYNLAAIIGPAFGKDQKVATMIGPAAMNMLEALKNWDAEVSSVTFVPTYTGGR